MSNCQSSHLRTVSQSGSHQDGNEINSRDWRWAPGTGDFERIRPALLPGSVIAGEPGSWTAERLVARSGTPGRALQAVWDCLQCPAWSASLTRNAIDWTKSLTLGMKLAPCRARYLLSNYKCMRRFSLTTPFAMCGISITRLKKGDTWYVVHLEDIDITSRSSIFPNMVHFLFLRFLFEYD